jgi:hypothetical protein
MGEMVVMPQKTVVNGDMRGTGDGWGAYILQWEIVKIAFSISLANGRAGDMYLGQAIDVAQLIGEDHSQASIAETRDRQERLGKRGDDECWDVFIPRKIQVGDAAMCGVYD